MKYLYHIPLSPLPAVLDICEFEIPTPQGPKEVHVITRINTPRKHRGQGHASKLLKQALADADKENITLCLEPSPSDGLNYQELVAWYTRHGFKQQEHIPFLIRSPNK